MINRILVLVAMMLAGTAPVFAQAAAESVMIHSMAAGAGAKAGTSLGRSTSNAAGSLGGRLGSTMSGATSSRSSRSGHATIRPAAPATATANAAVPCVQPDAKPAGQTQAGTAVKPDCQAKTPSQADQDKVKYKKFVTLNFDK